MNILFRVSTAKIKGHGKLSALQSLAIFASMLVVSFFIFFISSVEAYRASSHGFGLEATGGELQSTIISLNSFFDSVISTVSVAAAAVIVLCSVSIFSFSRVGAEKNKRLYATLTSLGATRRQCQIISLTESALVYGLPTLLGSYAGMIPSVLFAEAVIGVFDSDYSVAPVSSAPPLILSVVVFIIILITTHSHSIGKGDSIIEAVKAHNESEANATHSYRRSYTFRSMSLEKRLARKNVSYHKSEYIRIALMLLCCIAYPLIAFYFFYTVNGISITDYTPGYGIDTEAIVLVIAGRLAIFGIIALLALTLLGIFQATYLIRLHYRSRKPALKAYRSLGMTDKSIGKMLRYEYRTVVFYTLVCLIAFVLLGFVFIYIS